LRIFYYILSLCIIGITSCNNAPEMHTKGSSFQNKHAENFKINEISDGYILTVFDGDMSIHEYLLSKSDSSKKITSDNIIRIPVKNVVCFSSTHCAFIDLLGHNNSIKAVSGTKYIYNSEIRKKIDENEILEIGYDNQIDYEKIIAIKPDVIFAFSVDNNAKAALQKFNELNIPVVYINEFIETELTGRTEWLKFFSCFYDELDFANYYCDSVFQIYDSLKYEVANYIADKPTVLSSMPWKGVWWSPGGNSYFSKLIDDAGGKYILKNNSNNESVPYSVEEVFGMAKNVDIWLNPNNYTSKSQMILADERLKVFEPLNNAKIYNNNKRISKYGGNDFWESGVLHPDIVMKDLIKIFHPEYNIQHNLYYYQRVY
jgi:iron complex transport system substrate-binding protein